MRQALNSSFAFCADLPAASRKRDTHPLFPLTALGAISSQAAYASESTSSAAEQRNHGIRRQTFSTAHAKSKEDAYNDYATPTIVYRNARPHLGQTERVRVIDPGLKKKNVQPFACRFVLEPACKIKSHCCTLGRFCASCRHGNGIEISRIDPTPCSVEDRPFQAHSGTYSHIKGTDVPKRCEKIEASHPLQITATRECDVVESMREDAF